MSAKGRISFYIVSFIAFALFWVVALGTGDLADWPFAGDTSPRGVQNYSGPLGSLLAWLATQFLGRFFAWFIPAALLLLGLSMAFDKISRMLRELLKVGGLILLLNVFFSLASYTRDSAALSGWAGKYAASALTAVLGEIGSTIVVTACLLIAVLSRVGFLAKAAAEFVKGFGGAGRFLGAASAFPFKLLIQASRYLASSLPGVVRKIIAALPRTRPLQIEVSQEAPDLPLPPENVDEEDLEAFAAVPQHQEPGRRSASRRRSRQAEDGIEVEETREHRAGRIPLEEASLPELSLLEAGGELSPSYAQEKLKAWAGVLEDKLANYNIKGKVTAINHGPLITTFEFEPAPGVKVRDITSRADDITLAMKAKSLRLVAPIPGRPVVGIEMPNPEGATVYLREILQEISEKKRLSGIIVAIGVDVMGKPFYMNLCNAPHLLIAGTTGSGKSVSLHGIITSILLQYRPSDVRLLIIDPKMVEMNLYNGIPHLLHPVTNDPRETVRVFQYLIEEMERRKELCKKSGVKNIESFNMKTGMGMDIAGSGSKLPHIVLVIDELGDLVLAKGADMEYLLSKLSNMARAVGIHMIVATQRPSVDVIIGRTKANFPTRIAFRVASRVDSRTILDSIGAEKLLGRGDMLYMDSRHISPVRLHGALISEEEVEKVVSHWTSYQFEPSYLEITRELPGAPRVEMGTDPLYEESRSIIMHYRQGSTSLLQRKLHIGYARAARLLDQLEQDGVVGPPDGSKPREVLVPEKIDEHPEI